MRKQLILLFALLLPATAGAATYYVDPSGAGTCSTNDARTGTDTSNFWCTPPGTRTANNSGFLRSTWGSIDGTPKIACGDTIILKAGSTQTSTQGGAWRIDTNFYTTTCDVTSSPITITVSTNATWSGSSGDFTLNAAGVTGTYGDNGWSSHGAAISVENNGIKLLGIEDSSRLVVDNGSAGDGMFLIGVTGSTTTVTGFRGDWWELRDSYAGFQAADATNWQVSNAVGHNIAASVFSTGASNDHLVTQGGFVDVTAHDSGCGSAADPSCTSGGGFSDEFFLVGGRSLWCVRCTAYNGGERGFNTGVIGDTGMNGDFVYRFRDIQAWDNGEGPSPCSGGGPHYCSATGWDVSGNDNANSDRARNYVMGARIWGHNDVGIHHYGGSVAEIWNATTYHTNINRSDEGSYCPDSTGNATLLANVIDMRSTGNNDNFGSCDSGSPDPQGAWTVVDSCWRSRSADSETLGGGYPGSGTYTSPPAYIGATNLTKRDPGTGYCGSGASSDNPVVALSTSSYAANDFSLQADSTAIDAGRSYLLANGASSGNTITVKANGGTGDPRNYLIGPASYLDPAAADMQVQIEGDCGVRTITAMDATTITFDGASCSWLADAMVHEPWNGTAPDMGALEYAACHGGR